MKEVLEEIAYKEQINRLNAKLINLQSQLESQQLKEKVIKIEKLTKPADYEKNKEELLAARKEICKLKKIIESGKINSLEQLVDQYENFTTTQINKIIQEFLLYRDGQEEREIFYKFIEMLELKISLLKDMADVN